MTCEGVLGTLPVCCSRLLSAVNDLTTTNLKKSCRNPSLSSLCRTPLASTAVDTGIEHILDVHTYDDVDKSRSSEDDRKSGWNTRLEGGTYRGML